MTVSWLALAGLPGGGALALRAGHPRALVLPNPLAAAPLPRGGDAPAAWAVFALGAPAEAHPAPATAVACREAGRGSAGAGGRPALAVTGAADGSLRLWALADGRLMCSTLTGGPHPRGVAALAFAGPHALVAGGDGGELVVWGWPAVGPGAGAPAPLEPLARIAPQGPLAAPVSAVAGFGPPPGAAAREGRAGPPPGSSGPAAGGSAPLSRVVDAMRGCGEAEVDETETLLVAAGTADGAVRVWEVLPLGGGQGLRLQIAAAEQGSGGPVTGLSFRTDGEVLAVALAGSGSGGGGAALHLLEKADGAWRGAGKFALPAAPLASEFVPIRGVPSALDPARAGAPRGPGAPMGEAVFVCDARGFAQLLSGAGSRRQLLAEGRSGDGGAAAAAAGAETEGGQDWDCPVLTAGRSPAFENHVLSETQTLLARLAAPADRGSRPAGAGGPSAGGGRRDCEGAGVAEEEVPRAQGGLPDPFEREVQPPVPRQALPLPQPQPQPQPNMQTQGRPGAYLRKRLEVLEGTGPAAGGGGAAGPHTPAKQGLRVAIPTPGMRGLADLMSPAAKTPGSKAAYPADRRRQLPPGCPLAEPCMYSSARLQRRVRRIQAEQFDPRSTAHVGNELDASKVAAEEAAAREVHFEAHERKYSELTPIEGSVPESLPRKVRKQIDPKWVASLATKPQMSDLWVLEDRMPHVCSEGPFKTPF